MCNDLTCLMYSLDVIYGCQSSEPSLWLSDMWLCNNHPWVLGLGNHNIHVSIHVTDMAEAAAVVGLVASIASLVDLSAKVACRIRDFTSKSSDVPESFRSLSTRLPLLTATLQHIQSQAEAGYLPEDVTRALNAVVDNTSEQISTVQTSLSKILPSDAASKLERALKALKSLAREDKVQQALERIYRNNDTLVLHQTTRHVDAGDRILETLSKLSIIARISVLRHEWKQC